ncbi:APH(3') family aminoglycoside O-phosphotransferase [Streptomyces graminilatus]|uniref:APH(3') family aminoglycoside O-phosphotransferase n=1 Tax=Streptomyces graminilatus TaxID=1464070 RepID=UPI0006E2F54C|nr:APH(3') family aminoglycoside O-phosphotransferase [Streptomyces graminilatus]
MDTNIRQRYPGHEWTLVTEGDSGAVVYRLSGVSDLYAKIVPGQVEPGIAPGLEAEALRLRWLAEQGFPTARVVDLDSDGSASWLVMEAVPGVTAAAEWPRDRRRRVAETMADTVRLLHELPADDCPFDQSLAVTVPRAERNLEAGLVDMDDLDEERLGWSGERLLDELRRRLPAKEDIVVCHGDPCPGNVLLDPESGRLTGVIDVGRLGRADRHADLALAIRELGHEEDPWFGPECVTAFVERYGPFPVDQGRVDFYQLLDEFF